MSYSLNTTTINTLSKEKPKNAVILCHGYGGDGKDISLLANYWKTYLPETIFFCPDAPEKCAVSPTGFQWFDLMDQSQDQILSKSIVAEIRLNKFIDEIKKNNNFTDNQIALVGFSQGCMISIQTGLQRKDQINCIIGYSGKVINQKYLIKNINSKPKIFLMHGTNDAIVSPNHLLEAKDYLKKCGLEIKTKLFKNCEHNIPVEGTSLGLAFLKKNLL